MTDAADLSKYQAVIADAVSELAEASGIPKVHFDLYGAAREWMRSNERVADERVASRHRQVAAELAEALRRVGITGEVEWRDTEPRTDPGSADIAVGAE